MGLSRARCAAVTLSLLSVVVASLTLPQQLSAGAVLAAAVEAALPIIGKVVDEIGRAVPNVQVVVTVAGRSTTTSAAATQVIRGLTGDRILVLQDGPPVADVVSMGSVRETLLSSRRQRRHEHGRWQC